jgi:archaemetzincin
MLPPATIPYFAYYPPRKRYIADSLLIYLRFVNRNKNEKIMGITSKDISTRKIPFDNWGVLGLGSCPGEACVISSFRAGKNKVSAAVFEKRMIALALHELGHTYGLEHCAAPNCIMKDAKGKMALDDGDSYCEKCKNYLHVRNVLR